MSTTNVVLHHIPLRLAGKHIMCIFYFFESLDTENIPHCMCFHVYSALEICLVMHYVYFVSYLLDTPISPAFSCYTRYRDVFFENFKYAVMANVMKWRQMEREQVRTPSNLLHFLHSMEYKVTYLITKIYH